MTHLPLPARVRRDLPRGAGRPHTALAKPSHPSPHTIQHTVISTDLQGAATRVVLVHGAAAVRIVDAGERVQARVVGRGVVEDACPGRSVQRLLDISTAELDLGFGRAVASDTELPNGFMSLGGVAV